MFLQPSSSSVSFVDRAKDTLKVSGVQVSPTEVEEALMSHPDRLLQDVCVAGVSGGRTSDEKNPRAWLILSEAGKLHGEQQTIKALDEWARKNLSRYKWLRGGYEVTEVVSEVILLCHVVYLRCDHRYLSLRPARSFVVCCRISMSSVRPRRHKPSYNHI